MSRFVALHFPSLRLQLLGVAHPELRHTPWVLGLRQEGVHARVQDASPEAIQMGIEPGMHLSELRRQFPQVPVVAPDSRLLSRFRRVLSTLCDARSTVWAVDDEGSAILDLGGISHFFGSDLGAWCGHFRADLARVTGVSDVNIAMASSRAAAEILARVRSDLPLLEPGEAELETLLGDVPLDVVPWLGKAVRDQMDRYHLRVLSDVRRFPHAFLKQHFGDVGERLSALSRGLDTESSCAISPALAEEHVFPRDESDYAVLRERVHELADRLSFSLRERCLAAREVRLGLSWTDGQELSSVIRSSRPCRTFLELRDVAWTLLSELSARYGTLRALRLSVPHTEAMATQEDLFAALDDSLGRPLSARVSEPSRYPAHTYGMAVV